MRSSDVGVRMLAFVIRLTHAFHHAKQDIT